MALAIENAAQTTFSGSSSKTIPVTTSGADRIICVLVYSERNTTPRTVVSSVANASGLTWARRVLHNWDNTVGSVSKSNLELWWAHAPVALTANTITVTLNQNTDDSNIIVFAVSGAEVSDPWDHDPSLPATGFDDGSGGNTAPEVTGVSTATSSNMLLWFNANSINITAQKPSSFTSIITSHNGGGALFSDAGAAQLNNPGQQTNATFTSSGSAHGTWGAVVDAIVALGGQVSPTPDPIDLPATQIVDDGQLVAADPTLTPPETPGGADIALPITQIRDEGQLSAADPDVPTSEPRPIIVVSAVTIVSM